MNIRKTTHSAQETLAFGTAFAEQLKQGCIIILKGDLGAGKTTFVKGIARGLNINDTINSPTFNIQKVYQGRLLLNHIDAYRLEGIKQDLGFEDYFDQSSVTIVEWPEYIMDFLPEVDYTIEFKYISENTRDIIVWSEE